MMRLGYSYGRAVAKIVCTFLLTRSLCHGALKEAERYGTLVQYAACPSPVAAILFASERV